jgi:hypothetical protein
MISKINLFIQQQAVDRPRSRQHASVDTLTAKENRSGSGERADWSAVLG